MPKWLLLTLLAGALNAAVIRGVVVENQTGKPLARALVVAQPVAGTAGVTLSARTNSYGAFEFPAVPAGAYLVTASRRSFAPLQYGQKRWKAAGVPVVLEEAGAAALNFRLQRFGAITGTVVDENDVGLPEHEVTAYRNTRPPQLVARATTDDRGMYRLWGLEPGSYLVRTAAKKYDDDTYLPTFSHETSRVDEAHPTEVALDQQSDQVNVRPFPGRLYTVAGQALMYPQAHVTLTLVSDVGSETTTSDGAGRFQFNPAAPGSYELYAQAQGTTRGGGSLQAGFIPLIVDRDRADTRIRLGNLADLQVLVEDTQGQPVDAALFQLTARRKNLSGEGPLETLRTKQGHVPLLPGRWDLALAPISAYYVAAFSGPKGDGVVRGRADGWNEILATEGQMAVKFILSPAPGLVHGTVTSNHLPAAGAPVYLEAFDLETRKRLTDLRTTRTDLAGKYQFYGLPPGNYRILSTFEYQSPDPAAMEASSPLPVKVEEARDVSQDLELFVIR
ncbi:MAG: carboxypeptidase regulatory-like domain-containing protein [Acidobacteriia bacterium]|nr:carboxypeptidase regulatory-like domain-containing protein [Terriglobia bacterium]